MLAFLVLLNFWVIQSLVENANSRAKSRSWGRFKLISSEALEKQKAIKPKVNPIRKMRKAA
jgi:hypothetical protein